jgi:hypothetical protein
MTTKPKYTNQQSVYLRSNGWERGKNGLWSRIGKPNQQVSMETAVQIQNRALPDNTLYPLHKS